MLVDLDAGAAYARARAPAAAGAPELYGDGHAAGRVVAALATLRSMVDAPGLVLSPTAQVGADVTFGATWSSTTASSSATAS